MKMEGDRKVEKKKIQKSESVKDYKNGGKEGNVKKNENIKTQKI